jgi:hypothetical protein
MIYTIALPNSKSHFMKKIKALLFVAALLTVSVSAVAQKLDKFGADMGKINHGQRNSCSLY